MRTPASPIDSKRNVGIGSFFAQLRPRVSQRLRWTWLAALVVGVAAVVPFLSTLSGYFLCDDFGLIWLFSQKPPLHFLSLFTNPWTETIYGYRTDELRPFVELSYQVDAVWGAAFPTAYHISNILFHALNALLVLAIGRRVVGLSLPASCLAGVIFAVMPVHVETVAWISGRADSMPTLFYLASFLFYAIWREKRTGWLYWASIGLFFCALFSKQSAITMLGTLVLYDGLIHRRLPWSSWAQFLGYVPYAVLTFGYLGLRLVLFDNAIREQAITLGRLGEFWQWQGTYLQMVVSGIHSPRFDTIVLVVAAVLCVLFFYAASAELRQQSSGRGPLSWTMLFYFGPVWWTVSIAPLAVTNYLSSRHLYLASAGLALVLGLAFEALWSSRRRLWRPAAILVSAGVLFGSTLVLLWAVGQWNGVAALSEKVTRDVGNEAMAAPEGSLLLLDVSPIGATPRVWTWLWAFSLPYALQPPFMPTYLAERVSIVSAPEVYCYQLQQWYAHTQRSIATWSARTDSPSVIVLAWDSSTRALIRQTDVEQPSLRSLVQGLAGAPSPRELDILLRAVLRRAYGS